MIQHKRWGHNGNLGQWVLDQFEPGYLGHAIDVGASDGYSVNTTWALERAHRWTVLSVEANPFFKDMLRKERAFVEMCAVADKPEEKATFTIHEQNAESYSALKPYYNKGMMPGIEPAKWLTCEVPVRTVDQLLEKWQFPKLDLMAVDVEGGERAVFEGTDLARWKPKVIVSEAWERGHEAEYLAQFGYKLVARNVDNDLYILQ